MFSCNKEKECQQYLNGELELPIEPPITEKPECDGMSCPIFLEFEKKAFSEFLESPLYKEINDYLSIQEEKNAKVVDKILTKTEMVKK